MGWLGLGFELRTYRIRSRIATFGIFIECAIGRLIFMTETEANFVKIKVHSNVMMLRPIVRSCRGNYGDKLIYVR
jgi:hypothetical protein